MYQNCQLVLKGSFWFFLVLFLVLFSSVFGSLVLFQFYTSSSSYVRITKIWKSESCDNCPYFVTCEKFKTCQYFEIGGRRMPVLVLQVPAGEEPGVGCKVDLESFKASDITIACNSLCLAQGLSQLRSKGGIYTTYVRCSIWSSEFVPVHLIACSPG